MQHVGLGDESDVIQMVCEHALLQGITSPDRAPSLLPRREGWVVWQSAFYESRIAGRLNGFALARHVQDHHHRVGVIIGSGKCRPGPDDVAPGTVFLQKPYPLDRLVREVRRLAA